MGGRYWVRSAETVCVGGWGKLPGLAGRGIEFVAPAGETRHSPPPGSRPYLIEYNTITGLFETLNLAEARTSHHLIK
eukprot:4848020-Pleurochrysis_carterae.AAC.1